MGETILVVDDDAMNLKMAEMMLKKKDYNVKTVESGQAALALLQEEAVDLILLDVEMPGMNGVETLDVIRARANSKNIPVLFLSASEDMEQAVTDGQYLVQGFVKKPVLPQKLYESVTALFV